MMRHKLLADALTLANSLPASELIQFLSEIRTVELTAQSRLFTPAPPAPKDNLLTVAQAAEKLAVSKLFLYRHAETLPFAKRVRGLLRFSSAGIDSYLKGKK
jgi:hypothetical protein